MMECLLLILFFCLSFLLSFLDRTEALLTRQSPVFFPKPQYEACHAPNSKRICNPDKLLSLEEVAKIESMIHDYIETSTFYCYNKRKGINHTIDLQMGIYIELLVSDDDNDNSNSNNNDKYNQPSLRPYRTVEYSDPKLKAIDIYNDWDIGFETKCGSSGILLYLAVEDRRMYIFRGDALDRILTDSFLSQVLSHMAEYLKLRMYYRAIETGILDMADVIHKQQEIYQRQQTTDFIKLIVVVCCFWVFGYSLTYCINFASKRVEAERQRSLKRDELKQKLKEMDEIHDWAIANKFYMARSCPICLNAFPASSTNNYPKNSSILKNKKQRKVVNSGQEDEEEYDIHHTRNKSVTMSFSSEETPLVRNRKKVGSDGFPLRLLSCGHVFDDTCINDWIEKDTSSSTPECPICGTQIPKQQSKQEERLKNNFLTGTAFAWKAYEQERHYRLKRLLEQYPAFLSEVLVEDWTKESYNDSLLQDFGEKGT